MQGVLHASIYLYLPVKSSWNMMYGCFYLNKFEAYIHISQNEEVTSAD